MKRVLCSTSHPQDEADGGHSRRGHDFGTVGHEVQQRGHDALRPVVKLVTQQWRQMSERGKDMLLRKSFTQKGGEKLNKEDKIWHLLSEEIVKNVLIKTEHLVHLSGGLSERRWHYRGWQDPRRSHRFINLLLFQCISALFHLIRVVLQFRWRMFLFFFLVRGARAGLTFISSSMWKEKNLSRLFLWRNFNQLKVWVNVTAANQRRSWKRRLIH